MLGGKVKKERSRKIKEVKEVGDKQIILNIKAHLECKRTEESPLRNPKDQLRKDQKRLSQTGLRVWNNIPN